MLGIGRVWLPVRLRGSFFRRTVVRRPPVGRDRLPVRLRGSFLRRTVVRRPPVGRDRLPVRFSSLRSWISFVDLAASLLAKQVRSLVVLSYNALPLVEIGHSSLMALTGLIEAARKACQLTVSMLITKTVMIVPKNGKAFICA